MAVAVAPANSDNYHNVFEDVHHQGHPREFGKDCFSISSFASFSLITLNTILNVITNINSNSNDNNNNNNNNNNANTNMNLGRRRRHVNTTQGAEERCGHMSPSSLSTIGQRVREAATRRHLAWIQVDICSI